MRLPCGQPGDQRRFLDDAAGSVDLLGEPGQRPVAGAVAGSFRRTRISAAQRLRTSPRRGGRRRAARTNARTAAARRGVAPRRGRPPRTSAPPPRTAPRRAVLPAGDPDARDQPAQVPLPAAGVGLVEVVEVEDQITLGRGVEPEVAQVRVAAHHRRDARGREFRHVLGHHDRGAAQEPVGRGGHAPDTDRDQPLDPALVAEVDQVDRIGPVRGWRPFGQRFPRDPLAQALAQRIALRPRHRPLQQRPVRAPVRIGEDGVPGGRASHSGAGHD